ncbi:MAG: putative zinc-binding metallopeptidase, partial [Saccharospirillum sp.]
MQLFRCESCGHRVYFENTQCTQCGAALGFDLDRFDMVAIRPLGDGRWQSVATGSQGTAVYYQCSNYAHQGVCNWLLPEAPQEVYCVACRLNQTIPDLSVGANKTLWARLETEKRRLVYSLLKLNLPLTPKADEELGLAFRFLADTAPQFNESGRVITGHEDGVITLNIADADPVTRAAMRSKMAEP